MSEQDLAAASSAAWGVPKPFVVTEKSSTNVPSSVSCIQSCPAWNVWVSESHVLTPTPSHSLPLPVSPTPPVSLLLRARGVERTSLAPCGATRQAAAR